MNDLRESFMSFMSFMSLPTDDLRGSSLRKEGPSGKEYIPAVSSVPPVICGTSRGT